MRTAKISRNTKETNIELALNIDGMKNIEINTGIGFFDHMLTLFAFHGGFDLNVKVIGDINVDDHHTVEDVGIVLGQAFYKAVGDRIGINRYATFYVPMDESLSRVVIDVSNRPALVFKATFNRSIVGTFATENVLEFFKAFTNESKINLHIENLYGENTHHQIESIFKAFGRALKEAIKITSDDVSSTKGVL
jgi:imidazoleglycerol-phosphate dehydratase